MTDFPKHIYEEKILALTEKMQTYYQRYVQAEQVNKKLLAQNKQLKKNIEDLVIENDKNREAACDLAEDKQRAADLAAQNDQLMSNLQRAVQAIKDLKMKIELVQQQNEMYGSELAHTKELLKAEREQFGTIPKEDWEKLLNSKQLLIDELQQKLLTTQQTADQKLNEQKQNYEQKQNELTRTLNVLQEQASKYSDVDEKIKGYEKKIGELNAQIDATQMQLKASERIRELATSSQMNEINVDDAEFQKIQELAQKSLNASRAPRKQTESDASETRSVKNIDQHTKQNSLTESEASSTASSSVSRSQKQFEELMLRSQQIQQQNVQLSKSNKSQQQQITNLKQTNSALLDKVYEMESSIEQLQQALSLRKQQSTTDKSPRVNIQDVLDAHDSGLQVTKTEDPKQQPQGSLSNNFGSKSIPRPQPLVRENDSVSMITSPPPEPSTPVQISQQQKQFQNTYESAVSDTVVLAPSAEREILQASAPSKREIVKQKLKHSAHKKSSSRSSVSPIKVPRGSNGKTSKSSQSKKGSQLTNIQSTAGLEDTSVEARMPRDNDSLLALAESVLTEIDGSQPVKRLDDQNGNQKASSDLDFLKESQ